MQLKLLGRKMNDVKEFEKVLSDSDKCVRIVTLEEDYALEVVQEAAMNLSKQSFVWTLASGVREGLLESEIAEPAAQSPVEAISYMLKRPYGSVCVFLDLAEHIKNGVALRLIRDSISTMKKNDITFVLIDNTDNLPAAIKSNSRLFEMSLPDADEIGAIVKNTLRMINSNSPIEIGVTKRGMDIIIRNLQGLTRKQIRKIVEDTVSEDHRFDDDDINVVLSSKRRLMNSNSYLEYVQTPLTIDEIGGMRTLKSWLKKRKGVFSKRAKDFGLVAPKGVLLLGVQGAGKSLCAKALATGWKQPLLKLDVSALYNSYIGETERNLRTAFKQIEMMAPAILWIDEVEKAFAGAAAQSSDGGLSKRMFGSLLTWMQDHEEPVFVVATANDIAALPPELLRKGRFDEIFFVDLPKAEVREKIFKIHLEKRGRDSQKFDLQELSKASEGFSGAEIEQAVINSMFDAFTDDVELNNSHIINTLETSPPISVTMAEKISELRSWAEGRCTMAD